MEGERVVLLFGGLAHICVLRHVGVMKENKRGIRSGCLMDWFIKLYVVSLASNQPGRCSG